jgi:hypothetical protein
MSTFMKETVQFKGDIRKLFKKPLQTFQIKLEVKYAIQQLKPQKLLAIIMLELLSLSLI